MVRNCSKILGFRGSMRSKLFKEIEAIVTIATRKPKEVMMITKIGLKFLKSSFFFVGSLCMYKMILCVIG